MIDVPSVRHPENPVGPTALGGESPGRTVAVVRDVLVSAAQSVLPAMETVRVARVKGVMTVRVEMVIARSVEVVPGGIVNDGMLCDVMTVRGNHARRRSKSPSTRRLMRMSSPSSSIDLPAENSLV